MIRVLQYGLSSNLGGIETYLWNLSQSIDRDEFAFDFLYSDNGQMPALSKELEALGSRFFGVTPRRVSARRNREQLTELITLEHFDILHLHVNTASYVEPVRVALRSGVPTIVHSHNAGSSRSPITQTLHRINSRVTRWDRVRAVAVSDQAARWMFGKAAAYDYIPNGIATEDFRFDQRVRTTTRTALNIGPDTFLISHVGAFLPAKNQRHCVDIFAEVVRDRSDSAMILVGTGPLEESVRNHVRKRGLQDRVHFLGSRDDVPALLSAADALLFPSRYEGFGLAVLEAQAAGLPCCVSEAVPPAVLVLPTTQRLSLSEPATVWAKALSANTASSAVREAAADRLDIAGFTVAANAEKVANLYRSIARH
ncbi:MAG: glycosyltransferase [Microthrixaceae bacterium]|nr:glycosyltransferase [Microthrixaceae bacterium]